MGQRGAVGNELRVVASRRNIPFSLITPLVMAFAALDDVVRGMLGVVSRSGTGSRGRSGAVRASSDCYHATTMLWVGWLNFREQFVWGAGDRLAFCLVVGLGLETKDAAEGIWEIVEEDRRSLPIEERMKVTSAIFFWQQQVFWLVVLLLGDRIGFFLVVVVE